MEQITALLDEHGGALYSFCLYLAKNRHDGEDLFQQTFLRAAELSHKIDRQANPKGYLLSIAVNLWRNTSRKRARRSRITQRMDAKDGESVADPSADTEGAVIGSIRRADLLAAVGELDDRHRIPLLLFYTEEMKISQIAAVLKLPEGTIKRRLHEARQMLKKEMEAMGYDG